MRPRGTRRSGSCARLAAPLVTRDCSRGPVAERDLHVDHTTWNNARPDNSVPFVSGTYRPQPEHRWPRVGRRDHRDPDRSRARRGATVWRFAHHRSDVTNDLTRPRRRSGTCRGRTCRPTGTGCCSRRTGRRRWARIRTVTRRARTARTRSSSNWPRRFRRRRPSRSPRRRCRADARRSPTPRPCRHGWHRHVRWAVSSGSLPGGLSLDSTTGVISGTPLAAGAYSFTVSVADAAAPTNSASGAVTISIGASPVAIATASLNAGRALVVYGATLQASGGTGAYTWSLASGTLPDGLALDPSGAISGLPRPPAPTRSASRLPIRLTRRTPRPRISRSSSHHRPCHSRCRPCRRPAARCPTRQRCRRRAEQGVYSWTISAGALPAGLSLDAATGAITGTPAAIGSSSFTITVADVSEPANRRRPPGRSRSARPRLSSAPRRCLPDVQSVSYKATVTATGGQRHRDLVGRGRRIASRTHLERRDRRDFRYAERAPGATW